ncbi:MAG: type II toxin-antitoxin system RelE/ParE family toxin [Gammaproteobacteria bacterium]|nr:type II toxin-antitoxin system RelE/ParE family toxin [Gammaproteobacteria bacterium]
MADFQVLWTDAARLDLERIVEFIAEENPANAFTGLARLEQRCQALAALPERGRIVPEARAVDVLTYRELIEGPWRIVYRYDVDRVHVMAVLETHREVSSQLLERLVR